MNVLVVEDDELLADGLVSALAQADYSVTLAKDGNSACNTIRAFDFDLVVLDLGLPDMDGTDIIKLLRRDKLNIPILVLTARDGMDPQVTALDAGADDYMEKPFDLRELLARIRALIRRAHTGSQEQLSLGPVLLDPFSRRLTVNGETQELPAREYEVMEALMLSSPRAVSKTRLAQRLALNGDDIGDNAVEVYIHRLRKRLDDTSVSIQTIRGIGYSIEST